jgi:hypothetical protein
LAAAHNSFEEFRRRLVTGVEASAGVVPGAVHAPMAVNQTGRRVVAEFETSAATRLYLQQRVM